MEWHHCNTWHLWDPIVHISPMKQRVADLTYDGLTCHIMPLHDNIWQRLTARIAWCECFTLICPKPSQPVSYARFFWNSTHCSSHWIVYITSFHGCFFLASREKASTEAQLRIARRAAETHFGCIASQHGERCGNQEYVNSKPSRIQRSFLGCWSKTSQGTFPLK